MFEWTLPSAQTQHYLKQAAKLFFKKYITINFKKYKFKWTNFKKQIQNN